jgi:hypothetical protein
VEFLGGAVPRGIDWDRRQRLEVRLIPFIPHI